VDINSSQSLLNKELYTTISCFIKNKLFIDNEEFIPATGNWRPANLQPETWNSSLEQQNKTLEQINF
jgi:hypothetical protein